MWPKSLSEIAHILASSPPTQSPHPSTPAATTLVHSLSTDSRKVSLGELFFAIRGETHDGHQFVEAALQKGAAAAVVESRWLESNPQWAGRCMPVKNTTDALRQLGKAFRSDFPFPVFAIGGSNGKTTTKEMLSCLLGAKGNLVTRTFKSENGFLGLAITLTNPNHKKSAPPKALVAEIGIDEVGAMSEHVAIAQPDVALLTALGPEHLAGLGSWNTAVEEELLLFRQSPAQCRRVWQLSEPRLAAVAEELREGDVVVIDEIDPPRLDRNALELIGSHKVGKLSFRMLEQRATHSRLQARWCPQAGISPQNEWTSEITVPLPGIHNARNFALALATAALTGAQKNDLESAWSDFVPPEMRSRIVQLVGETTLYDDCYNASPASMDAAFDALLASEWKSKHKVLILGDMLDLGTESKSWHLGLIPKLLKIENSDLCLFGTAMYDVYTEIKINHSDELQSGKIQLRHAGPNENPAQFLTELGDRLRGSVVLVKGSRGMDLGRFVKSCEVWSSAQG
ncbi:MAG: UDP-N-acetylmuramoyl-tripeptide--D-alanyl-D-alanine ligase [Silvanigrellaceae bacterium]